MSNLGDLKNPGLRQNVISGHVSTTKVANMTAQVSIVGGAGCYGNTVHGPERSCSGLVFVK